ncbi:MAG: 4'-phosphopantetheinyl transferase superfamily protein [Gemmatimonadetes bacterium]|nr:4'-phosphopantetheinyl transferase superfamily protein [Gemmatimonadota bacterium]
MSSATLNWGPPPPRPALEGGVHVWCAPLDPPAHVVGRYRALLAVDEGARADRFRFEQHRRQFVVARGVLRTLLGRYLSVDPRRLEFRYGSHGKPELAGAFAESGIRFNVSHSGELALYAVSRGRELGVDIEHVHPMDDGVDIAERFFSAAENVVFRALAVSEREEAFFNCWTRKEAYIKAVGEGLSFPLHAFDVSLAPGEPARLLGARDEEQAARWTLRELDPAPGYKAALVVEGEGWETECWSWDGHGPAW